MTSQHARATQGCGSLTLRFVVAMRSYLLAFFGGSPENGAGSETRLRLTGDCSGPALEALTGELRF